MMYASSRRKKRLIQKNLSVYLVVKTWLFDKRARKFSPSSINARSRAAFMQRADWLNVRGVYQTAML